MKEYRHEDYFPPGARDIVGKPITPRWHVLEVPTKAKMAACREMLKLKGVFSFYPSFEHTRHIHGKAHTEERPFITGLVFALFKREAHWDVMRYRGLISGVMSREDGTPIVIPYDAIRHLQGMTLEAERLKAARAEFLRLNVGDEALVKVGPLAPLGHRVIITGIRGAEAWFDSNVLGIKGSAKLAHLEKVTAPLDPS